jgi:hypothetical protein
MALFRTRYRLQMTEDDTSGGGGGSVVLDNTAVSGTGEGQNLDTGGQNQPVTNEWDNLPRSWTRDVEPHWKATPAEIRQFIHRREADVERGIRGYADHAGRYDKLHGVFKDVIQQHPDFDVPGVYENLAQNHLALLRAEPEQRHAMFLRMAEYYGLDFANAAAGGQPSAGLSAAQRAEVERLMAPVAGFVQNQTAAQQAAREQAAAKAVDAFFSDPNNKYIKEVAPDVAEIIKSSQGAVNLKGAYEMACIRNPAIKAKYLADLTATAAGGSPTAGGHLEVKSSPGGTASPGKPRTIDETIDAEVARMKAAGRFG